MLGCATGVEDWSEARALEPNPYPAGPCSAADWTRSCLCEHCRLGAEPAGRSAGL